jgi:hypothetical protein
MPQVRELDEHDHIGISLHDFLQKGIIFGIISQNIGKNSRTVWHRTHGAALLTATSNRLSRTKSGSIQAICKLTTTRFATPAAIGVSAATPAHVCRQINVAREGVQPDQQMRSIVAEDPQSATTINESVTTHANK